VIPLLFLVAAAATDPALIARYDACVALTKSDPAAAVKSADAWRVAGGGLPARKCLGLAYVADGRWAPAAIAFEQAAREAEIQRDGRAAEMWVMAGNAALGGEDPAQARDYLDRALALPVLSPAMRGEAYMDRARAQVEVANLPAARADLDEALKLVPRDPMGWLLSATLARRQGDRARAEKDIAEALRLAPGEEAVIAESAAISRMTPAPGAAKVTR
jgi:tetratricopeptide (TPR) repeat protein